MMKLLTAMAILAGSVPASAEPTDDEIMTMTATAWAGINCGTMIPNEDYRKALEFTKSIDPEKAAFAMRRVKFMVGKASDRSVACQSVQEALNP